MHTAIEAKGSDGQVLFDGSTVRITRHGLTAMSSGKGMGGQEFPVSQITGIDFQPGTRFAGGWIDFALVGSGGYDSTVLGSLKRGVKSPTNVAFSRKARPEFEELYAAVKDAMARHQYGSPAPHQAPAQAPGGDVATRLATLDQLYAQGIVSAEEYQQQRAAILASL